MRPSDDPSDLEKVQEAVCSMLQSMHALERVGGIEAVAATRCKTAMGIWNALLSDDIPQPYRSALFHAAESEHNDCQKEYTVLGEHRIGAGGFGVMSWGWDWVERRPAAVKDFLRQRDDDDGRMRLRAFEREVAMTQEVELRSEGGRKIGPSFLFHHTVGTKHVLATEYCDGPDEGALLRQWECPSLAYIVHALAEEAGLLSELHRCGVAHLDVKPSNILLDVRRGVRVLCDYGCAKILGEPVPADEEPLLRGTCGFASPEQRLQFEPDAYTSASDVYALGVTAYERFCGDMEWICGPSDNPDSPLPIALPEGIAPAQCKQLYACAPKQIADFIVRMLSITPSDRPSAADCEEFFLRWSIHCNRHLLPSAVAKHVRTPAEYRALTPQERCLHLATDCGEDPIASLRVREPGAIFIRKVKLVDVLQDMFPKKRKEKTYLLPEGE